MSTDKLLFLFTQALSESKPPDAWPTWGQSATTKPNPATPGRNIDRLAYELYDLTAEEIVIVENDSK